MAYLLYIDKTSVVKLVSYLEDRIVRFYKHNSEERRKLRANDASWESAFKQVVLS